MSRCLLLLVFVLWMSGPEQSGPEQPILTGHHLLLGVGWFVGFYAILVGLMGLWSRWVARRVHLGNLQGRLRRFNFMMFVSRIMIPAWFGVGVYFLGWKTWVDGRLLDTPLSRVHIDLPSLVMGSLPAFLAWMGLWWSVVSSRDRGAARAESFDPGRRAPCRCSRAAFLVLSGRQLSAATSVYDRAGDRSGAAEGFTGVESDSAFSQPVCLDAWPGWSGSGDDLIAVVCSWIFIYGPEILSSGQRVLQTQSMPDTPLRRRLEAICQKNNIRYRDVLLWHTQHHMGNAAVMGFIPQCRYILLSDLLLETMTDDQIEAVFAHEVGHVMHKHMFWLVAAMAAMLLCFAGPGSFVLDHMENLAASFSGLGRSVEIILELAIGGGLFWLVFGFISRHCERQADVFAARTLQNEYEHSTENQIQAMERLTVAIAQKGAEIPAQLPGLPRLSGSFAGWTTWGADLLLGP